MVEKYGIRDEPLVSGIAMTVLVLSGKMVGRECYLK